MLRRVTLESMSYLQILWACTLFFGALTLTGIGWGFVLERRAWTMGRKIFDVPLKRHQWRTEIVGTVLYHATFLPVFAWLLSTDVLVFRRDSWTADVATFAICWTGFQWLYWPMHRAMHTRPLFWMHRWHHESLVTTPVTGLSMHPAEALGWFVCFALPALACSALGVLGWHGWLVFFGFHWVGNLVGHSNADVFPYASTRAMAAAGAPPIVYHSLHHARFDGHYGFASSLIDRMVGTEWADWLPLAQKVRSGTALKALREKA